MHNQEEILRIENLKKHFPIQQGWLKKTVGHVKAVDGISFAIKKGETLSLVGESGCGKSTTGRTILRLHEPTEGAIYFKGENILEKSNKEMKILRPQMQMIFQDPYSSLNPRMSVRDIVGEALKHHGIASGAELEDRVKEALEKSGLPSYHINKYPHEFSGGQRQRIGIARCLALNPEFIIADEPVSALDVSIQAQVINLLMDLQQKEGFSYLFISHDLSVVKHISDRVGVMYLGSLVELADSKALYKEPLHPYTRALIDSIPVKKPSLRRERIPLTGDIPSPANPPSGCKFHTRCPYAKEICRMEVPVFKDMGGEHFVACHLV